MAAQARKAPAKADNAMRTIGEVADMLGVQQQVLRYWESKVPQIKPLKRAGDRRYYRPSDIDLLIEIQRLTSEQNYSLKDVRDVLHGARGIRKALEMARAAGRVRSGSGASAAKSGLVADPAEREAIAEALAALAAELAEMRVLADRLQGA